MNVEKDHQFTFEKLDVWQDARHWVKSIYQITSLFPKSEQFGIRDQLNRAAVSVPTNLAEGSARISMKDQAHFSQIAYSSLIEALNLLILSFDQCYLSEVELSFQRNQIGMISTKLNALYYSQRSRIK